ncbi:hypothetical protein DITRI_Ditri19aG0075300 [Diplodiscus trichospermus]
MSKKSTSAKKAVASRTEKWRNTKKRIKRTEKAKKGVIDSNCINHIETGQSKGASSLEVCSFEEDINSYQLEPENADL